MRIEAFEKKPAFYSSPMRWNRRSASQEKATMIWAKVIACAVNGGDLQAQMSIRPGVQSIGIQPSA
jgi:hypothetical protein